MNESNYVEKYSYSFVLGSNVLQILIYLIGIYLVYLLHPLGVVFYLAYILLLEIHLLNKSCIHCYYYGKRCAFGKGLLCSLFFKKGDSKKFIEKKISMKDLIPDFLVTLIPLIIGVYLLSTEFNWTILILLVCIFILGFPVTGYLRGNLACKYCKQKKIGCPAEKAFNKKK